MSKLYFVRHGESVWNVLDKVCGTTDVELSPLGHEQAIAAGKKFVEDGLHCDLIIHSPLKRAADTAKHIAEITGAPLMEDKRLIEHNFGEYEGMYPRKNPVFQEKKREYFQYFKGGESTLKVAQRVYNLLDEIRYDDRTYMLVAHNGIARVVNSYFNDMGNEEYSAFGLPNSVVTIFDFDDAK